MKYSLRNSPFRNIVISIGTLLLLCFRGMAETNITVDILQGGNDKKINKNVFGTSILGWEEDHGRKISKNVKLSADYCYGFWDGKWNEYAKEPFSLVKNIKIGSIRLSGQFTGWEKGVGEFGKKEYAFGLNEQLKFCQDIGAEPIICLQNIDLTENYVKLFEYLKNNYSYVKYIEIGNESYQNLSVEDYTRRYLFYYGMIKNINADIKIGFVGRDVIWESKILAIIGNRFDFIVEHYYPHGGRNNDPRQDGNKVFADLFPKATAIEKSIQDTLSLMDRTIGERKPIAVTEYNAWFVQEKPVPYRHCLGTALINAELLRIFMKPESNILTANIWNFINEYWGMIANGFNGEYRMLNNPYYKRPNYLLFEMYSNHFGDILLEPQVICDKYGRDDKKVFNLSVNASKSTDGSKVYLMVINKNMDDSETSTIDLKDFIPAAEGNVWILNGPSVDATNEVKHDNVKITHKQFEVKSSPFEFTFEPHSLTAIELTKKQ